MSKILGRLLFVVVLGIAIVVAGGGTDFIRRPVGASYLALWMVWLLVAALWRKPGTPSVYDRKQRGIMIFVSVVAFLVLLVGSPWEYTSFGGPIPRDGPLAWVGAALFAAGIALQIAAMWALHGLYTRRLGIQARHRLVTSGPYLRIRHPGYLSYIVSLAGVGLQLSSLLALGLVILVAIFLLWRINREEAMLVAEFGEEYRAYMQRTKRLIPMVY